MKIKMGATRLVIICSKKVIKLPLFHVSYLLTYVCSPNKKSLPKERRMDSLNKIFRYIFSGFVANHVEYHYSKKNSASNGLMQTKAILWGTILIQEKGEVPIETDDRWLRLLRILHWIGVRDPDTLCRQNFCIWKGTIRILDYGHQNTVIGLDKINLKIIERFG